MSTTGSIENGRAVRTARREENEEVVTTIIETLAAAEGVDPCDLDIRIGDVVDPDALNTLFESATDRSGRFTVPLGGYLVRVTAAGEITLYQSSIHQ